MLLTNHFSIVCASCLYWFPSFYMHSDFPYPSADFEDDSGDGVTPNGILICL
jgi:hypothetical protein